MKEYLDDLIVSNLVLFTYDNSRRLISSKYVDLSRIFDHPSKRMKPLVNKWLLDNGFISCVEIPFDKNIVSVPGWMIDNKRDKWTSYTEQRARNDRFHCCHFFKCADTADRFRERFGELI